MFLSFLEILKFLGTQFNVVHRGLGGVDIFWIAQYVSCNLQCIPFSNAASLVAKKIASCSISFNTESEKDRFKGLEMREINETEKFTQQVFT